MAFDPQALERAFEETTEDLAPVKFGTSGHRGEIGRQFCRRHVLAIAQAVADLRAARGYKGAILIGGDTRLMSMATAKLAARVLTANGCRVVLPPHPVPTPVFSLQVLHNPLIADAIIGTASHNPPADMGMKYNPAHGGPADKATTDAIQQAANRCLSGDAPIRLISLDEARAKGLLIDDLNVIDPYLDLLESVIDFDAIRKSGLKLRIHPLGGAALPYFEALRQRDFAQLEIVDRTLDPSFKFVPLDHDGKTRMDPSSRFVLKPLLELVSAGRYEMAGATDPDADRFGVATGKAGLLNPNHALCVAADYLLRERRDWPRGLRLGRTIGTTHLLDRIAKAYDSEVDEVDVGFKYFVEGLRDDRYALVGEESAGLSFYRWSTEKDGIAAVLLFAEIMAKHGDLGDYYAKLAAEHGTPAYARNDRPANEATMAAVRALTEEAVRDRLARVGDALAGQQVVKLRATDGIKLYLEDDCGWVLVRPSGTEPIVKFYTEHFAGEAERQQLEEAAAKLFGFA